MKIEKLPLKLNREDLKHIGSNLIQNIKKARMKTGLSQLEMAQMLGYKSATALSLIESGDRKLTAETLWKIAYITGEPIRDFYYKGLI